MIRIYSDGSCLGNPGRAAGACTLVDDSDKVVAKEVRYVGDKSTNNVAELTGVIAALELLLETDYKHSDKTAEFILDSRYCILAIEKHRLWLCKASLVNRTLIQRLSDMLANVGKAGWTIKTQWVKGHAECVGNVEVDYMAASAAESGKSERWIAQ